MWAYTLRPLLFVWVYTRGCGGRGCGLLNSVDWIPRHSLCTLFFYFPPFFLSPFLIFNRFPGGALHEATRKGFRKGLWRGCAPSPENFCIFGVKMTCFGAFWHYLSN